MSEHYLTWALDDTVPGEPLPAPIYLYLQYRFVLFRHAGDCIDRTVYDRMEMKQVGHVFIKEESKTAFVAWISKHKNRTQSDLPVSQELQDARQEAQRKMMDIFHTNHANAIITQTLETSKNLVTQIMKFPFATQSLSQLQTYSRGTVDHSVNVSVLSIYLAMNMGYSHVLILRHIASGALLHDIGKSLVGLEDTDTPAQAEAKLKQHPLLALKMLGEDISREATMIITQHHERNDGSGYPKGLKGKEIFDLARIVAIANEFDELVSSGRGTLKERQIHAISQLEGPLFDKFDPNKLQKCLKILSLGI